MFISQRINNDYVYATNDLSKQMVDFGVYPKFVASFRKRHNDNSFKSTPSNASSESYI